MSDPASAKPFAKAYPIPCDEPVIRAVLPYRSNNCDPETISLPI